MTIPRPQIITLLLVFGALLALPAVSQAECPNEQLRQENNSTSLPDCRAYEQVSPSEKDGGSGGVLSFGSPNQADKSRPFQSLADGAAITYAGEAFDVPTKGRLTSEDFAQYTSVRSADGWGGPQNGDTLSPENVPTATLPPVTDGTGASILEETSDGAKVFFLDEAELIPGISNGAAGESDLYEYDVPSNELTDLTVDKAEHADVRGILGIGGEGSEEGSYVYFVAGGILSTGASQGADNLYLRRDGTTSFIIALSPEDEEDPRGGAGPIVADWTASPSHRTAQVSPNGRYVAFGSHFALTGQDIGESEIFRYGAGAVEKQEPPLVCVSCTSGGSPVLAKIAESSNAAINGANRQHYMVNDGRVFFDAVAELVPADKNHRSDVYEWEDGAPHLISGGTSEVGESVFADASANGSDVFFTTAEPLVPEDGDEITDLYDAREDGGFPAPPGPQCPLEASCPGARAPPPVFGAPSSATFSGTESLPSLPPTKKVAVKCSKDKKLSHGKCVKPKTKGKKKAKPKSTKRKRRAK